MAYAFFVIIMLLMFFIIILLEDKMLSFGLQLRTSSGETDATMPLLYTIIK